MKVSDILQLTVIIVGLFVLYTFLNFVPTLLYTIFSWVSEGMSGGYLMETLLSNLFIFGVYFVIALLFIKKSKNIGEWLAPAAGFGSTEIVKVDKATLLFALFVGMGIYGLVQNLPSLIVSGYNKIKSSDLSDSHIDQQSITGAALATKAFTICLYFVLLYYANVFAEYLSKKVNNTDPVDEIADTKTAD